MTATNDTALVVLPNVFTRRSPKRLNDSRRRATTGAPLAHTDGVQSGLLFFAPSFLRDPRMTLPSRRARCARATLDWRALRRCWRTAEASRTTNYRFVRQNREARGLRFRTSNRIQSVCASIKYGARVGDVVTVLGECSATIAQRRRFVSYVSDSVDR